LIRPASKAGCRKSAGQAAQLATYAASIPPASLDAHASIHRLLLLLVRRYMMNPLQPPAAPFSIQIRSPTER
jgi:hypothetical protein